MLCQYIFELFNDMAKTAYSAAWISGR